jgi:hypothetical protein
LVDDDEAFEDEFFRSSNVKAEAKPAKHICSEILKSASAIG